MTEAELNEVRVLRLQPGDIVVLTVRANLNARQTNALKRDLTKRFPENDNIIVGNAELSVVRGGEE